MELEIPKPVVFNTPLKIIEKTMAGAGPSNCHDRIRNAMSLPVLGPLNSEILKIMDDVKEGIQYMLQTSNSLTFCVSGPGHAGLECALVNLLEDGDTILIASSGFWGQRAELLAKKLNADVKALYKHPGNPVALKEARECFRLYKPKVFFVAHGESSTGMLQDLSDFGDLCREYDCLFVVDCAITLGCTPIFVDKWKIDVAYSGTQKVLNASPGITPITLSQRSLDKIISRKTLVRSFIYDAILLGEYWNCFPNRPRIYHHTICPTLLYGLREAIALIIEQGGLESSWEKHFRVTSNFYTMLESNGLEMFIDDPKHRCPSVVSIKVPDNVDPQKVISYAMSNYCVEINGGLGPTVGKIFRIGLMGMNATNEVAEKVFKVLTESLKEAEHVKVL